MTEIDFCNRAREIGKNFPDNVALEVIAAIFTAFIVEAKEKSGIDITYNVLSKSFAAGFNGGA